MLHQILENPLENFLETQIFVLALINNNSIPRKLGIKIYKFSRSEKTLNKKYNNPSINVS